MNFESLIAVGSNFINNIYSTLEIIGPRFAYAFLIICIGAIIGYASYRFIMYIFWKFNIVDLINRIWEGLEENTTKMVDKNPDDNPEKEKKDEPVKKVQYDRISAKAFSYYIFLLFFRGAIVMLGITEIEQFMNDLIGYLPSLFVGIMIGFFGLRFANSVYDILYQTLEMTREKTSKIIAMGAKIIIMFFTLMIMLHYIKIVDQFIINTLFLGFVTTLTISLSLAFGIGGKDVAREILESFRK